MTDYKQPIVYEKNGHAFIRSKKMVIGVPYELEINGETWIFNKPVKNIIDVYVRSKKEKVVKGKKVKSVKPVEIINETNAEAV